MRAIAFVLVLGAASCATRAPGLIPNNELSLAGVAVGDSEAVVLSKLDHPRRSVHPDDYLTVQLESSGLIVSLDPHDGVGGIFSDRPGHCTPSGICVGTAFAEVEAMLGRPAVLNRDQSRYTAQFASKTDCWLEMVVHIDFVESIRVACPV
jgi:hypothetical protein